MEIENSRRGGARQGIPLEEDITPQAGAAGVLVIPDAFPEIQG